MVVVGAGRAGGSLARLWYQSGNVEIKAIYSRSGADELAKAVSADVHTDTAKLPHADFLMIATSDSSLNTMATQLAHDSNNLGTHSSITFHLSGACGSDELTPLRACGYDKQALPALQQLFENIGGRVFKIDKNNKTAYHGATVISSNGLFALADVALAAWQRAGIDPDMAREIFASLAVETARNIARYGPAGALTGPVSRGDTQVVSRQVKELLSNDEPGAEIYQALSLRLLSLAEQKLDQTTVKHLKELLTSSR